MANASVIDIDINDAQFRAFYELYQKFQGEVGALPEDWQKVGDAAKGGHEAMATAAGVIAESMLAARDHAKDLTQFIKEAGEAQKQFRLTTGEGETGLKRMKHEAKELADTIFGIGKFLFKMGAIGLGGEAFAGFGMNKLAEHAVANQRTARGLGLTTGQYRAFRTDMGRYVDESTLDYAANAKNDLEGRVWLQQASGLSGSQIDRTNAGDLAAQLAIKAHDWWSSTPSSQHNETYLKATGFTELGFSMDDMRRLGTADRSELVRAKDQYSKDSKDLNVSNRDTDALYSFSRQLELAGQKLETSFTNRLANLGPSLGSLITTLEKDAEILIDDVFSAENIKALEKGLNTLTQFLGSQEFKTDVKTFEDDVKGFVDDLGKLAKVVHDITNFGSSWTNPEAGSTQETIDKGADALWGWLSKATSNAIDFGKGAATTVHDVAKTIAPVDKPSGDNWLNRYFLKRGDYYGGTSQANATYGGPLYETIDPKTTKGKDNLAFMAGLEKILGLPEKSIVADVFTESAGKANAVSKVGAVGAMQLMPSTIKQYGVQHPQDFNENIRGGSENLARLYKFYDHDLRKAIAATNWGEGNLNKDIDGFKDAKGVWHPGHGADWENFLPDETRKHLERYFAAMDRYRSIDDAKDIASNTKQSKPKPTSATDPKAIQRDLAKATWGGKEPTPPTAKAKNDTADVHGNGASVPVFTQMNKLLDALGKTQGKPVNLTITNKSGTSVAVSTNAASI